MVVRLLLLVTALLVSGCAAGTSGEYASSAPAPPTADGYGYSFGAEAGPAAPELEAMAASGTPHQKAARQTDLAKEEGGVAVGSPMHPPQPVPPALPLDPVHPLPSPAADTPTDQSRRPMLIYKAQLGLAVFKVQEQLDTIEEMAVGLGGYLVARMQNQIRVRVPAAEFDNSIEKIIALGDVHHRQITTDDVTAEFTDLEIRLKNAVSVRERLQALLAQAKNVEEALEVERELQRLTDEIETMKGRMKLLSELAAFSTIDVVFSERTSQLKARVELPFPWLETMGLEYLLNL